MDKSLRDLRLEAGLTQKELAKKIGCDYRIYNIIERFEDEFEKIRRHAVKFLEGVQRTENPAIAKSLRRMRLKAGLTQKEVVKRVRCSIQHYSKVERGETSSPAIKAAAIALFEEILKGGKK